MKHNVQTRRAAQAARHKRELEAAQLQIRLLAERLHQLTYTDPYQSGFGDGVTVTIQQLHLWLTECRESAQQVIDATPVDHNDPDFKQGYQLASAWIDEAIEQLQYELERRTHAVATGQPEEVRRDDQRDGGVDRGGVPACEQCPGGAADPRMGH